MFVLSLCCCSREFTAGRCVIQIKKINMCLILLTNSLSQKNGHIGNGGGNLRIKIKLFLMGCYDGEVRNTAHNNVSVLFVVLRTVEARCSCNSRAVVAGVLHHLTLYVLLPHRMYQAAVGRAKISNCRGSQKPSKLTGTTLHRHEPRIVLRLSARL